MSARLPIPGGDDGNWGSILNDYLSVELNSDGSLKRGPEIDAAYDKPTGGIPLTDLAPGVQASLTKANNAPTELAELSDVSTTGASNAQVLSFDTSTGTWAPATVSSTVVNDASTSGKGIIQLAGDLGGSAALPTVPGLASKAIDANTVHNMGAETIAGVKTFTSIPVVPTAAFPESAVINLTTDLGAKAADVDVVHVSGAETIAGTKTFSSAPVVPTNAFPESAVTNLTTDLAAKATDANVVHTTGSETIAGVKTFTSIPVVPSASFPESAVINLTTDLGATEKTANKGAANGYAQLNSSGLVPTTQLGGSGGSSTTFLRGDGTWSAPSGGSGSATLAGDSDVSVSSPSSGQVLTYNGSHWANIASPRSALAVVYSADCPASLKSNADGVYTYQCTGTNDEVVINNAISQIGATGQTYSGNGSSGGTGTAPSAGGGTVLLMGYTFNVYAPIVLMSWVSLVGGFDRAATQIRANASFSGSQMIGLQYPWTERTTLRNFYMYGNKTNGVTSHGVYYIGQVDQVPYSYSDPQHTILDLTIHDVGANAVFIDTATRATRIRGVRVERATNYGFYINCPDSFFTDCESGGSGAEGWYVSGANCIFSNCKSWYSHTNDYTVGGSRNQFSNCTAQDAYQHGWNIISGKNVIVGCISDSAGLNTTGYGFYISASGFLTIRGCQAFDRNGTPHQVYGVYFPSKLTNAYASIEVVTYNNVTGSFYDNSGTNTADSTSLISIRGT